MTVPSTEAPASAGRLLDLAAVGLDDLGEASLLDRVDTKFAVPVAHVDALLEACLPTHAALEVDERREFHYHTQYFDTADLAFYRAHVHGHLPRHKVRVRRYLDAGTAMLEVKGKTNRRRTEKIRVPVDPTTPDPLALLARAPLPAGVLPPREDLSPRADISFRRATLVRAGIGERVTIDVNYIGTAAGHTIALPHLAIVEVKQAAHAPSPILEVLRALGHRKLRFSKYCLAIAALVPDVPRPRYRRLLERLAP